MHLGKNYQGQLVLETLPSHSGSKDPGSSPVTGGQLHG